MIKEDFELLPDNEKRILLAKDVIQQLKAEQYKACEGIYVESAEMDNFLDSNWEKEFSLQSLLPEYKCEVCAKGALFLSDIRFRNEYKVESNLNVYSSTCTNQLNYFSEYQLDLIEAAFEGFVTGVSNKATMRFYDDYPHQTGRLIAIMENIIANNGEFKI